MNSFIRIIIFSFLLLASSCVKNEFSIVFDLPEDINANLTASYYAADKQGGMLVETVAPVTNGKGELRCITRRPTLVYLYSGGKKQPAVIYAERGDEIKISGKGNNPDEWIVEGNDINREWGAWRNENAKILAGSDPQEINKAVEKFVKGNPASPLSTLLLLTSYSRRDDETGFRTLWQSLSGDAREPEWTELVGRADQPSTQVAIPAKLRSAVFRSWGNGTDTLRTDSVKATLLFFWNVGIDNRREHFDSLRTLTKEFPDSARRMIADVCLEADSLTWKSPLKSDSLSGVARLWAPAGMADSRLMDMGVVRSPFVIVFSPDGNQRYRGSDLGEALRTFRGLMK